MSAATVSVVDDLVAGRRRQLEAVVESLQAALDLQDVVRAQAATHVFSTVEAFLALAVGEIERARWAALMTRATAPVPALQESPT